MMAETGANDAPQDEMMSADAAENRSGVYHVEPATDDPAPAERGGRAAAVTVDHVADFNRRYPGESVTLFTRVQVQAALPGFSLRVVIPAGLELDTYRGDHPLHQPVFRRVPMMRSGTLHALTGSDGTPFPLVAPGTSAETAMTVFANEMIWEVAEPQAAGAVHEFVVSALTLPTYQEARLESNATVLDAAGQSLAAESVTVAVYPKGRFLEYLPALFEQDDFIGRFLMVFESFWGPISHQIDALPNYLDPALTPARFLPWLAAWFDLDFDETWSEAQRRELLRNIMWLYRRRGTRVALQRYLEIYTGQPVDITERRARNLRLGSTARLGVGVALGTGNVPHTFTVRVRLPALTPPPDRDPAAAAAEVARLEKLRRRRLEHLIEADKPAHADYHLEIIELPAAGSA